MVAIFGRQVEDAPSLGVAAWVDVLNAGCESIAGTSLFFNFLF
jgi:hypothetical protein